MNTTTMISTLAVGLLVLCIPTAAVANDLGDALANCKSIENDMDRLACFDRLAAAPEKAAVEVVTAAPAAVSPAPAAAPVAQTAPAMADEPLPLTDEVAKTDVDGVEPEQPEYVANVSRCQEARREKRKYFIMDNGQVWQQANAGRLRFRDKSCQFEVTLQKDYFGWVMEIPSEDREVRVKRVR